MRGSPGEHRTPGRQTLLSPARDLGIGKYQHFTHLGENSVGSNKLREHWPHVGERVKACA